MAAFETLEPQDPRRAGRYRILARLGAGGMGQVYLGRSPGGRLVAVKVVRPDLARDGEFRRRFAREVTAARRVNGAFTAGVVDADPDGSPAWLATVYVPGVSLGQAVVSHGPWPTQPVLALGAGLAEALEAIHAAGVIHRDLKPSNILLASDGPRVIDFGISVATEATALTHTGMTVGTPGFMSPEQLTGGSVGPASDIFALGAVLTYTATGTGPFGTGTPHALHYRAVHETPDLTALPPELHDTIAACLAKEPQQRPTIPELLDALGSQDGAEAGGQTAAVTLLTEPGWMPTPVVRLVQARTSVALPPTPPPVPGGPATPPTPTPTPTPTPGPEPEAARQPEFGAPPPPPAQPPWFTPPATPADAPPGPGIHQAPTRTAGQHHADAQPTPHPGPSDAGPAAGADGRTPPQDGASAKPPVVTRRRALLGLAGAALLAGAGVGGWQIIDSITSDSGSTGGSGGGSSPSPSSTRPAGTEIWRFSTGGTVHSPAVVGGVVYTGSSDHSLYAVDAATGQKRWSFTAGDRVYSPTVVSGVVYVGSDDDSLYAVDAATGQQRWSFATGGDVDHTPAVVDGVVYVGSWDNSLYAVDAATGQKRWSFATGDWVVSSPAVAGGIVYIGSDDDSLYAVDTATGQQRWSFATNDSMRSPTVVGGVVYIGSTDDSLYALDAATGQKRWSFATSGSVYSTPAVSGGVVYFGSDDDYVYALDATTGQQRWSFDTSGDVDSVLTVVNGVVYVGSWNDSLYALDAATGQKRWSFATGGNVDSAVVVAGGIAYFGSDDDYLYAVQT